jgi:hypothetical protein
MIWSFWFWRRLCDAGILRNHPRDDETVAKMEHPPIVAAGRDADPIRLRSGQALRLAGLSRDDKFLDSAQLRAVISGFSTACSAPNRIL